MKLIGNLLMTVCLLVGLLAAATSYLAPVGMADDAWISQSDADGETRYLHTSNASGAVRTSDEDIADLRGQYETGKITAQEFLAQSDALHAVVEADKELTPEAVEAIRKNELAVDGKTRTVKYVNVKTFSPLDWRFNWVFALSAIGLFTGSMLVRTATKAEIAAQASGENKAPHESPEGLLAHIRMSIDRLRADLEKYSTESEKTHLIVERVGELQKNQLVEFVDARPILIGRMGLGGYAELMDRFAAAERQINRAWSIAADGFFDEANECLENAAHLLVETQEKMGS